MSRHSAVDVSPPISERRLPAHSRTVALVLLVAAALLFVTYSCERRDDEGQKPGAAGADGTGGTAGGAPLTVNQTSTTAGLAPGRAAQPLHGTFTNPKPAPVYVATLAAEVTGTSNPRCPMDNFVISGSPARVDTEVATGTAQGSWSGLAIRLLNLPVNQDSCKSTRVSIAYTVR